MRARYVEGAFGPDFALPAVIVRLTVREWTALACLGLRWRPSAAVGTVSPAYTVSTVIGLFHCNFHWASVTAAHGCGE
jgi:hypothetical protein